jgi:hypothetical protein
MASPRNWRTATGLRTEEKTAALARLREDLAPGDTVYCVLRHRSRSGMQRVIQLIDIRAPRYLHFLGYNAAAALGYRYDNEREGVVVGGCGMDMGFHLVSTLSKALFGKETALRHEWL